MTLTIRGSEPRGVFGLGGTDENSATFALGWTLERSPHLLQMLVQKIFGHKLDIANSVLNLQKHSEDGGYTDLEIQSGLSFHAIIEAKRLWNIPAAKQLQTYVGRLLAAKAKHRRLVTISAADAAFARTRLPLKLEGISVSHLSWTDLRRMARDARAAATAFEEKLWLHQLMEHLQEFVSMERLTDNAVYVVALAKGPMPERTQTWIDVVEKDACYFHPVGNGWPKQPPNYIGFRYWGELQSIHHIESFEIIRDVSKRNRRWLSTEKDKDYFVYRLGPPMRPHQSVRTGNIFKNGRVSCAIDTLLSGAFATISAARDETNRRLREET